MSNANVDTLIDDTRKRMNEAFQAMVNDFDAVRTGKASPALVENLQIDYYGTKTKLRDIAGITAPEPRMLVIQPWDPTAISAIEKAIQTSNIGISPVNDGRVVRLPIPELSEERRQELAKLIKERAEEARVEIRNIRRDANSAAKKAEKKSEITEDDLSQMTEKIQELTDSFIGKVDERMDAKSEELMQV